MATLVTGAFGCIEDWVWKRLLEARERPAALQKAGRLTVRGLEPQK